MTMPSLPPAIYDPASVTVIWGGLPLFGFAPGTFINASRTDSVWRTVRGTNGEVVRAQQGTGDGTVTCTLRHSARVNRLLGVLMKVDEKTGSMIAPLIIADSSGGALVVSTSAYLDKYPPLIYSNDEPDLQWSWVCTDLDVTYPGFTLESAMSRI